jgi:hypothetical protein
VSLSPYLFIHLLLVHFLAESSSYSLLLLANFLQFLLSLIPSKPVPVYLYFPVFGDLLVLELFLSGFLPSFDVLPSSLSLLLLSFLAFGDFGMPSLSCPLSSAYHLSLTRRCLRLLSLHFFHVCSLSLPNHGAIPFCSLLTTI